MNLLGGNTADICSTRYLTPMVNHELSLPCLITADHPAYDSLCKSFAQLASLYDTRMFGYELLAEAKKRDMHIIMDLVINHCSDKHEWFQKALADPDGAFADYFYFRKGKNRIHRVITVPILEEAVGKRYRERTNIIFTCLQRNSRI